MPVGRARKSKDAALESFMEPSSELSVPEMPESDSDYEEAKVLPRRGGKRGRPNPTEMSGAKKGRRGPVTVKAMPIQGDGEGSLFEIVKSGKVALSTVVDDWIEAYKQDRDTALLDLIQFFINCSGCRGRITPQMYQNMEHAEIIRKMTEEFDEESGDYPLILAGPQWKKFKANFCEFIMVLVRQCQYSIIYDQYMMDNVISLLTGLTDSQVRAFRHTSTLAAMKLMTALVDVALNLSINLDHTQRQYEAERAKHRSKQASSERLEMLMAKRQEIEENQEEIRNMLTYIFKGVFVHRYRDTQPDIRGICMAEIGIWMKRYPGMFLDDSYLKYVGWTLYDRCGDVRLCCLRCLQPLYDTDELAPKLELFTNRFRDRIVEMTLDKEYDVAVGAVRLVISVLKRFSDQVLSDKDCENVYELVYSSHRAVAQAAGEFLNCKLFSQEADEATRNLKTKKGKKRSENTPKIRDLVQFFIESELHEHGAYLVDSLWEINDMLKDWECMTDLLLEEAGRGEEAMDDRQESSLIEMMVCCVKQAATGEYPVGRGPTRKLTTRESRQVLEDKTKLTEHFIVALPQLLAKYGSDGEKAANLLQIPLYFDLEIYTTSRQEKNLDGLLKHIQDIVDKNTESEVLENCSKVLENFCNDDFAIANKCNVGRARLMDHLVERYKEAFQDFFHGGAPDEDDAFALMASLKRIYAFFCCHNLNPWGLWDSMFAIIKGAQEGHAIPEEIVNKSMACCGNAIYWHLEGLDENNPDKVVMKELKRMLSQFMRVCHELLFHQQERIQEEAYITICDMLIMFSKHMGDNHNFQPLQCEPDKALQGHLSSFLNEKVFIEDDDDDMDENQKIEELHKRRNFLACFCKLVVYNVVHIRCASNMFKYYMRFYNDYGDIIKATLGKSREINKVHTAKTLAVSLTQLFTELQSEQGLTIDRTSEGYQAIKELARRFSLSFGLDQVKNREAVAAMHKEGIHFGLWLPEGYNSLNGNPPPNLAFLEILTEFTSKLMKQDKRVVLKYLERVMVDRDLHSVEEDPWMPMLTYRNSLQAGDVDMPAPVGGNLSRAGKRRAKRRPAAAVAAAVSMQQEGDESGWMSKETPHRGMPQPLTSTAVKRRRTDAAESESGSERDFELPSNLNRKSMRVIREVNYEEGSSIEELTSPPALPQPRKANKNSNKSSRGRQARSPLPDMSDGASDIIEEGSDEELIAAGFY